MRYTTKRASPKTKRKPPARHAAIKTKSAGKQSAPRFKKIATRRKKGKTAERKPDSVALANRHSFICAGGLLRPRASLRSATYPMCYGRAAPHPTLSCTELGLQCPSGLLRRRWSLTPPFHPYRLRGGIFSVALSMRRRFPPPPRPFKRSSALWCPDFPLGEPSECLLRSLRKKSSHKNGAKRKQIRIETRRADAKKNAARRRSARGGVRRKSRADAKISARTSQSPPCCRAISEG